MGRLVRFISGFDGVRSCALWAGRSPTHPFVNAASHEQAPLRPNRPTPKSYGADAALTAASSGASIPVAQYVALSSNRRKAGSSKSPGLPSDV